MSRTKVRLPLPRKTGSLIPSRGKEHREPLVGSDLNPEFCPDCNAQLNPDGVCPESETLADYDEEYDDEY